MAFILLGRGPSAGIEVWAQRWDFKRCRDEIRDYSVSGRFQKMLPALLQSVPDTGLAEIGWGIRDQKNALYGQISRERLE